MYSDENKVDVRDLQKIWGIKISNPEYNVKINNTVYDRVIIGLNKLYRSHRSFIKLIWKEDDFTKTILDSVDTPLNFRKRYENSADKQIGINDGNEEAPFFRLDYIQFAEFLPKESLYDLKKQIRRFKDSYVSSGNICMPDAELAYEDYARANRNFFETRITHFSINQESDLGKFFSACEIQMESASLSFVLISIRFYVNDKWKNKISDFAVSNTNDYKRFFYLERIKLRDIRVVQEGCIGADIYKEYALACILEEMKFRARTILKRHFEFVTNTMRTSGEVFMFFETNIDANSSKRFWLSIGVFPDICFLSDEYDACITYINNNISCINRSNHKCQDFGGFFHHQIANQYNHIIAFTNIKHACNEQISHINKWMHDCEGKGIELWLHLFQKISTENSYIQRFLGEYNMNNMFSWDFKTQKGNQLFSKEFCDRTNGETQIMNEDIMAIKEIIERRINAEELRDSYKIQHLTYTTNFVSAIFAFIAIVVSIMLNDSAKVKVAELFSVWPVIQMAVAFVLCFLAIRCIIYLFKKPIHLIEKWRIFD
jgi:hypothetical protein